MTAPYNPLEKRNLAISIENALLARAPVPLTKAKGLVGAGVYALYFAGDFQPYSALRCDPGFSGVAKPIYVGKAIPEGGRMGGLDKDAGAGKALSRRLGEHRRSLKQAENLRVEDFWVRFLLVDDIWIPLGENVLIESFLPLWNAAIFGFGNNAPGRGREKQVRSPWDALHPGRAAFRTLPSGELTQEYLLKRVSDHIGGRPLDPLPSSVKRLVEAADAEALEGATQAT